jgi:hypothetical protein
MKAYKGVDVWIHIFLTAALTGGGQLHDLAALPQEKEPPVPTGQEEAGWAPEPVWTLWRTDNS